MAELTFAQQMVLAADRKRGLEDGPINEPAQEGEFNRRTRAQMVEALATTIIRNSQNLRPYHDEEMALRRVLGHPDSAVDELARLFHEPTMLHGLRKALDEIAKGGGDEHSP